jgi:hypothetical protein
MEHVGRAREQLSDDPAPTLRWIHGADADSDVGGMGIQDVPAMTQAVHQTALCGMQRGFPGDVLPMSGSRDSRA